MNAVIPVLTNNTTPGALIIVGGIVFVAVGVVLIGKTEAVVIGALLAFIGAIFGVGLGVSYIELNGDISTVETINRLESHYGVVLEEGVDLPDFTDDSSFVTLDVIDVYTNEVHENARLVWNGVELTLLVKDEVAKEYVPMVSSE